VRDHVLEFEAIAEDAHQQRDLETDERAHHHHQRVEDRTEHVGPAEGEKEDRRRQAADGSDEDLHDDELSDRRARDVARHPRPDAHREEIRADDGGELRDAVAEQIAGQRAGHELVDQPARRDEENRRQECGRHGSRMRGEPGQ
jgi:hypothetical protein